MVDIYVEDLKTGSVYSSRVIGRDPWLDLALLTLPQELEHLAEASLVDAVVGEIVFAIGFPYGVRNVSYGIITSKELVSSTFLLSQAPLNPGNSGGPLLNAKQEVVGINTAYRPDANLYSFSIPSSYVRRILPQLVEGGTIRHAYPKLVVGDFRDLLPRNFADMGIPYPLKKPGVVVLGFRDEAASQQGIEIGDLILSIDGVRTETVEQYVQQLLFSYKSGQRAKFLLFRGLEEVTVDVKLSLLTIEQQ
ncbi:MAG: HtrA2 peptidase [Parcubacteria group bacterium Greene1014_15]|nr:MAG: HtrA2 peptidase [Parcubacteria group bacterium Greene1014_15]